MDQANPTAPPPDAASPEQLSPAEIAAVEQYIDAQVGVLDALTNLANAIAKALQARTAVLSAEQPSA